MKNYKMVFKSNKRNQTININVIINNESEAKDFAREFAKNLNGEFEVLYIQSR